MHNIAILGATGYTAIELIKILLHHPFARIVALTSREETRTIDKVHPQLAGRLMLPLENLTPSEVASRADCVFSCLPHCATAKVAPELLAAGTKVIDFGADYRLDSPDVFESWYGEKHPDPERLGKVPYGLPELYRSEIVGQNLIANPGCYPTSAILALTPLLQNKLIEPDDIIIDSKSGVSGGGRKPKLNFHYPECNESIVAYGVGTHRHTPEINRFLSRAAGTTTNAIFTAHLVPMDRGILSTIYAKPTKSGTTQVDVIEALKAKYAKEPFVQVVEELPATKDVSGTNHCHITARMVQGRVMVLSVIDNLIKGAAGAAVQNFNVINGYDEQIGLT